MANDLEVWIAIRTRVSLVSKNSLGDRCQGIRLNRVGKSIKSCAGVVSPSGLREISVRREACIGASKRSKQWRLGALNEPFGCPSGTLCGSDY